MTKSKSKSKSKLKSRKNIIDRFILDLFHKRLEHLPSSRGSIITLAGMIGIACNLLMAAFKLTIGLVSHSVTITYDAINNITDSASSIIILLGVKLSSMRPSRRFPLGYGRIEYFSSIIISVIVLSVGISFLRTSVDRVLHPAHVAIGGLSIVVLIIALGVKIFLSRMALTIGHKVDSSALIANGTEATMDISVSVLAIVSSFISAHTKFSIDGYVGSVLAVVFIYNGLKLVIESLASTLGERIDAELATRVRDIVSHHDMIYGVHDIVLHSYGPSRSIIDMNIELPDYATAEEIHSIMIDCKTRLKEELGVQANIGIYSVNTYDDFIIKLRDQILDIVLSFHGTLSIHAFHVGEMCGSVQEALIALDEDVVMEEGIIRFDVVVDYTVHNYNDLYYKLYDKLKREIPQYEYMVKIEPEYS
ncbi:MAG: cation diffusion facilitator family transporter [Clostridiales Family XIII bacterium]|jgi:cation diffusion facilitator family transporter|nr:cation diffusion facilitator family transporter [Clostridiales Family XIII bacterium]